MADDNAAKTQQQEERDQLISQLIEVNAGRAAYYRMLGELFFRELTQEQAKLHPGKNVITRAVGTEPEVEGDVFICKLRKEECILLCSDGLSNEMADQEMLFEVVHGMSKSDCCQRLLHIAKKRGAPDNVAVALSAV